MVLKRKKNCKILYEEKTSKYYVEKIKNMQEFYDIQEAFREYGEIHKIEKEREGRYFKHNKLIYELYPDQVFLIAKSLEILKFFIDKSMFFNCDKEDLKSKSLDIFYLYQILYKQYIAYAPKKVQSQAEEKYKFLRTINY